MMPRSHSFAISLNRPPKWRDKVRDRMAPSLSRHCSRQNGGRGLAETGLFPGFAVIAKKIAGFAIRQYPAKSGQIRTKVNSGGLGGSGAYHVFAFLCALSWPNHWRSLAFIGVHLRFKFIEV